MVSLRTLDFQLEQLMNAPTGHLSVVDQLMVAAAAWAEPGFIAGGVIWFLDGVVRVSPREKLGCDHLSAGRRRRPADQLDPLPPLLPSSPLRDPSHHRPPAAPPPRANSFPSDHAAGAFGVAVVLFGYHRRLGVIALLVAAWVSYARVYVGDHWCRVPALLEASWRFTAILQRAAGPE